VYSWTTGLVGPSPQSNATLRALLPEKSNEPTAHLAPPITGPPGACHLTGTSRQFLVGPRDAMHDSAVPAQSPRGGSMNANSSFIFAITPDIPPNDQQYLTD
jgi:hypothetical protein